MKTHDCALGPEFQIATINPKPLNPKPLTPACESKLASAYWGASSIGAAEGWEGPSVQVQEDPNR